MKNFNTLLEYLGLSDEILPTSPTEVVQNEKFSVCSSGIAVQENGKVAVYGSGSFHKYVLGENVYQRGIVRFKLKLESFQNNNWILVGIVKRMLNRRVSIHITVLTQRDGHWGIMVIKECGKMDLQQDTTL